MQMSSGAADRPLAPGGDTGLTLAVSAVAARIGVAPATLRTWDRRYGLGPAQHTPGSHRRYAPQDVARLMLMVIALRGGATPAEAAGHALRAGADALSALIVDARRVPDSARTQVGERSAVEFGTSVLLLSDAGEQTRELAAAALALDADGMQQQLRNSIVERGVTQTWEAVVRPVLSAAGDRWAGTGGGTEIEHLLSECVSAVMFHVMIEAAGQTGVAPVLLACMPGEQHGLPLRALGAALASRRVPLIALGGDTPAPALAAVITAREPAVVFLWAQMDRNADPFVFEQLPPSRYVLGGPAWRKESLEADVQVVHSLTEAADVLVALCR